MNRIDVPIHLQDTVAFCGRACAQMVARALTNVVHQQGEFTTTQPDIEPWASTPDQVADFLNQFAVNGAPPYRVFLEDTAEAAIARMRACVEAANGARFPAVALVRHGQHWEIVNGFTEPNDPLDSVHLRNPAPARLELVPPIATVHVNGDECDLQNVVAGGAPDDEAMTIDQWRVDYFSECRFAPEQFTGKFIVVAPDMPPVKHLHIRARPPTRRDKVIPARELTDLAFDGVRRAGLATEPGWSEALSGVPFDALQPWLLVHRLNRPGAFYLVALTKPPSGGVLVSLDAQTGDFLYARLNPPPRLLDSLFTPLDGIKKEFDPAGALETRVAWAPVQESFFSPCFPLLEFSDKAGPRFYVRLFDRKRFSYLEPGA